MKYIISSASALFVLLMNNLSSSEVPRWTSLEVFFITSEHDLEGPAVTGYEDIEEERNEIGFGLGLRGRVAINELFHVASDLSYEVVDGEIGIARASLSPGAHIDVGAGIAFFAEAGVSFVDVRGTRDYARRLATADGDGGSDTGVIGVLGIRQRLFRAWEWSLTGGYLAYGREKYPTGSVDNSSTGDGPHFSASLSRDISGSWSVVAAWTGTWVEDAGMGIDLATTQYRLGLQRTW